MACRKRQRPRLQGGKPFSEEHRTGRRVRYPRQTHPAKPEQVRSHPREDRKSTRLNSSHVKTSYAVFCLKKKIFYTLFFFRYPEQNIPAYRNTMLVMSDA